MSATGEASGLSERLGADALITELLSHSATVGNLVVNEKPMLRFVIWAGAVPRSLRVVADAQCYGRSVVGADPLPE